MSKQLSPTVPVNNSNLSAFLTNLRLLDLDKRSDWLSITLQTFSVKDAQQNQKSRIRSVEWALYRLFEKWDPEETKNVSSVVDAALLATKDACIEAPAILSSPSPPPITQPPCCAIQESQPTEERRIPRERCHN